MKKFICIALMVCMCLAFTACEDKATTDEIKITDIWEQISGTWVYAEENTSCFITFSQTDDKYYYTSGIMFSGAVQSGEITEIKRITENQLGLVVNYPEVKPSEENSGYEAQTKVYVMDTSAIDKKEITLDDIFVTGAAKYNYAAQTLDEAMTALSGNQASKITLGELWPMLEGVWVSEAEDGNLYFIWFNVDEAKYCYTSGIMFSGAISGGAIGEVNAENENTVIIKVNYPEIAANEENDGSAAQTNEYTLDISSLADKIIAADDIFTEIICEYRYIAPTLSEANEKLYE